MKSLLTYRVNYVLNEHEDFDPFGSFTIPSKTMWVRWMELQSGNAQYRSKLASFWPVWPWNLTDGLEQDKSEEFDSCDRPNNLTQIGFKSSMNQPVWPWNLMDDLEKQGISSILHRALCIIPNPSVNSNRSYSPEMLHSGQNWWFFCPTRPWKTRGHIFFATSSFVSHFIAIYSN